MAPASAHTATTEPEAAKARPVGFHVYAELKIEFPLPVLPGKQVPVLLLIAVRAACSGRQFLWLFWEAVSPPSRSGVPC